MGLKSGEYGAKKQFLERFPDAFVRSPSMFDLRAALEAPHSSCVCVIDGNVEMMSAPAAVTSFEDFVRFFKFKIISAIDVAQHVIVVFDEPEHLTEAKKEEQAKRDAARQRSVPACSNDLVNWPTDDNFSHEQLRGPCVDIQRLFKSRATRSRTIDAICMETLECIYNCRIKNRPRESRPSLTFDGVDERGAHRPIRERRVPAIVSTETILKENLKRDVPMGEGDLKITSTHLKIQSLRNEGCPLLQNVDVCFLMTIDTDSLLIELLQQSKKNEDELLDETKNDQLKTILCLKERSQKRKVDGDDTNEGGCILCVDLERLESDVGEFLMPRRPDGKICSPRGRWRAIALLSAGLALSGCDFVELKGLRADFVFEAAREVCQEHTKLLKHMENVNRADPEQVINSLPAIRRLVRIVHVALENAPRMQRSAISVGNYDKFHLLRAAWTVSYWSFNEQIAITKFGFVASQSSDLEMVPKPPLEKKE